MNYDKWKLEAEPSCDESLKQCQKCGDLHHEKHNDCKECYIEPVPKQYYSWNQDTRNTTK